MDLELSKSPESEEINETIVAQSTALGIGAVAIVRLSGSLAFDIASQLAEKEKLERIQVCFLKDSEGKLIDQALLLVFHCPNSFTGEDIVEFQVHGNQLIINKLITECIKLGARLANPGEFTKRAFLNGKINLTEAEAILDLIHAKSNKLLNASINQLSGKFYEKLKSIQISLESSLSYFFAASDFPEQVSESQSELELELESKKESIFKSREMVKALVRSAQTCDALRFGLKTVIIGHPNVGKSSLLNALLKEERAIVSPEAGTTRDFIREQLVLGDIPLVLIDTAGIKQATESQIEEHGIKTALNLSKEADLILFVFDAHKGFSEEDKNLRDFIKAQNPFAKMFLLANKSDLLSVNSINSVNSTNNIDEFIFISSRTGEGLDKLGLKIAELVGLSNLDGDFELSLTQRQAGHLISCEKFLDEVLNAFDKNSCDLFKASSGLESALSEIYQLLGHENQSKKADREKTLDRIFSNFCIGK